MTHITLATSIKIASGDALNVTDGSLVADANSYIVTEAAGAGVLVFGGNTTMTINGVIGSTLAGIEMGGVPTDVSTITIGATGVVGGTTGILTSGQPVNIINNGLVFASGTSIDESGDGNFKIVNGATGQLGVIGNGGGAGLIAIHLSGNGTHTINNSGYLIANNFTIQSTGATAVDKFTMSGGQLLGNVDLGGGDDVVNFNAGLSYSSFVLGSGADKFSMNGGSISGFSIDMGTGDDTFTHTAGKLDLAMVDLGDGADTYIGSAGVDKVIDNGGSDKFTGGDGADTWIAVNAARVGSDGLDNVDGGLGSDTYDASAATHAVTVDLTMLAPLVTGVDINGTDLVKNFETFITGSGNDTFKGGGLADGFSGGGGADSLVGGGGGDLLSGGNGNDTFIGGAGRDICYGDSGADVFVYLSASDSGLTAATRDIIGNWDDGLDKVDLHAIATTGNVAFHLTANSGLAAFSHSAGELREVITPTGTVLYGDKNGDAVADFTIGFAGALLFKNSDFIV